MRLWSKWGVAAVALAAALAAAPDGVRAQEPPRATVQVRQVAGTTLYLDLGTRHGLAMGDTVQVLRGEDGPVVGSLHVTAASEERSVLAFAGPVFAVTRGEVLTILLLRAPPEVPEAVAGEPADVEAEAGPTPRTSAARAQAQRPPASGRWSLDLTALHSTTTVGGADPVDVGRTYATPALRLDATVPEAVGGFRLRTSLRLAYRYSDPELRSESGSARVYHASLERTFGEESGAPFRVALGRFHSPLETYSGYWDGMLLRLGPESLGVGVLVGFEPDRFNESPSTDLPKATAVLDGDVRGPDWRWRFDASAHTVRPAGEAADHTFLGLSQRLTAGPFYGSQDLQVDRDPSSGTWEVTELRLRGSLQLSPGVTARGGFLRRTRYDPTYVMLEPDGPFGPRGDRVSGGLSLRSGEAFLSGDVSRNTEEGGAESTGVSGSFSIPRMGGEGGPRLSGSVSHWSGDNGTSTSAAPSLVMDRGASRLRFGYRLSRWSYLDLERTTHAADVSLDGPLAGGYRGSIRLMGQFGGGLQSQSLRVTLSKAF